MSAQARKRNKRGGWLLQAVQNQWGWLLRYDPRHLPSDLIAGATVATMLIPQSMAYALLAGVPPIVGLYTGILPVFLYGLLASGSVLTFGPTAITAVMVLSAVTPLATPDTPTYLTLVLTLTLCLGVVFLLMGVLRAGFLVNFFSQPVMSGYVNAAALTIAITQVPNLLGISIPYTSRAHELLLYPLARLQTANSATLLLGGFSIAVLLYFRHGLPAHLKRLKLPALVASTLPRLGPLLTVLLTIGLVAALRLDATAGVRIIGDIPSGLPSLAFGPFDFEQVGALLPGAFAIALVGFMEGISTIKSLTVQRPQRVRANQELIAMGAANVASALSGGFAATTSISRTAVNAAAGARTGLSSMIAAGLLALTVLFFTPLFYYLPSAALAAIILVAVLRLINFREVLQLWRYSRTETVPFWVTFFGVFIAGIEVGIFVGTALMLALHLARTVRPYIATLGNLPGTEYYRDVLRYNTLTDPHTLILRPDESLYFANAQYLSRYVRNALADHPDLKYVLLVCSSMNRIDGSAMQLLAELRYDLDQIGIRLLFAEFKESLLAILPNSHFIDAIDHTRIYETTHAAVLAIREAEGEEDVAYTSYRVL